MAKTQFLYFNFNVLVTDGIVEGLVGEFAGMGGGVFFLFTYCIYC